MNRLNIALTRRGLLAAGAAGTAAAARTSSQIHGRHFIFCFSPNGIFCNSIDCPKGFRCCS